MSTVSVGSSDSGGSGVKYIETKSGTRLSRAASIHGMNNIVMGGHSHVHDGCSIRGDVARITLGRNCILGKNAAIKPPQKRFRKEMLYIPVEIGHHVTIGENSVVEAAQIGSYVKIGKNCVLSRRCIIKDCCEILDGTVIPADAVVPPFVVFGGTPGSFQRELPESAMLVHQRQAIELYKTKGFIMTETK